MTDREYVEFLNKCASISHNDYSWLKDHCYKTLKRPCSPNTRNEHLAILDLIKEHEERQWIPVSERLPEDGRPVLIYAWNVHHVVARYDSFRTENGYKKCWVTADAWNGNTEINHEVIAWMPLPEHYKETEDV